MLKSLLPKHTIPLPAKPQSKRGDRVAVVGSGISGLSAAWLLSRSYDVTLFEKNDYPGGHSHTVDIEIDGVSFPVDTGFIVYNPVNYPNLTALFKYLNVPTEKTNMSFGVSLDYGKFEYSGTGLKGLFAQRSNLLRSSFWVMLKEIWRFYRSVPDYLQSPEIESQTIGQLLQKNAYSQTFIDRHLAPMGGSIWSLARQDILDCPAAAFLRFFQNHGLTQLRDRPQWRTVTGGSREYVQRLLANFTGDLCLNTSVENIRRKDSKIVLSVNGIDETYDHVVLACHSDQALSLLGDASHHETEILGSIRYQPNRVFLHRDSRYMPRRKTAWSSWNYLEDLDENNKQFTVTYWMNRLQSLPTKTPVFVTLNPSSPISSDDVLGEYVYDHPVFDRAALTAQKKLWSLQGRPNTWFCGAYFGLGFHEDGIQAGLAVAEQLSGNQRPWSVLKQNARIGLDDHGHILLGIGS